MCGITGIINLDGHEVDRKILKRINDTISHRGPDDEGFFEYKNVGFGARRLSIIDLPTGHQPLGNEDGSVWITFNGEIYNFPVLRELLLKKGHKFKTKTDTEAIVHLYEEYGDSFVSRLDGMFAFAIFDIKKQRVVIARDRMGEKPLYYGIFSDSFIFASELKAILSHPNVKRRISLPALNSYLSLEYVPAPDSIICGVSKLPQAGFLILDLKNRTVKTSKYWEVSFEKSGTSSFEEYKEELDKRLYESVKNRMISDVPLGLFLSGGLDSSTLAYYMSLISPGKINSFSIGFSDTSFDESLYARSVAKIFGTQHHEKIMDPKQSLEIIPKIPDILDEPMADASIIPTYLLSQFTRKYVKVALGGDGGDELFMGYPTYQAHKFASFYSHLPLGARNMLIKPLVNMLPVSFNNFSLDFTLKRFINKFDQDCVTRNNNWLGSFSGTDKINLLSHQANYFKTNVFKKQNLEYFNEIILSYLKGYLPYDILVKTDRAAMYASLETRAPFLDHKLVNFVNSVPVDYKLHGFTTKYILKKLMEKRLPKEIVYRKKKGFGIPLSKWLTSDLKSLTYSFLSIKKLEKDGIFNPKFVERILEDHLSRRKDNRKEIWTVLMFQMWKEYWKAEI